MSRLDLFTQKRIQRFIDDFRGKSGQLPTLPDFETGGFTRDQVDAAIKVKVIEQFYVTLNNGTIMKGFKRLQEI